MTMYLHEMFVQWLAPMFVFIGVMWLFYKIEKEL